MKVREGERVTKGQLLYTLSTPELNAKLLQAEALRSAAEALDKQAVTGARKRQKEAALNLWKKAQAGPRTGGEDLRAREEPLRCGRGAGAEARQARANYEAMKSHGAGGPRTSPTWWTTVPARRTKGCGRQGASGSGAPWTRWSPTSAMRWSIRPSRAARFRHRDRRGGAELVGRGYPVVAILDMSDLWVVFNVKETMLPHIGVGTRMIGYVPALDRDLEFEVSYVSVQADFATWACNAHAGRIRHPHVRRQGRAPWSREPACVRA